MEIIEQLSAEFKVQLIAEARNTFSDMLGLCFQVKIVVETDLSLNIHCLQVLSFFTITYLLYNKT